MAAARVARWARLVRLAACTAVLVAAALAGAAPLADADADLLSSRIFGGDDALEDEFPSKVFLLSLVWSNERSTFEFHFCGGTIITAKWILTAAHCVNDAQHTLVKAGSTDRTVSEEFDVEQKILHESYRIDMKSNKPVNDIALLELASPLALDGATLAAARLPPRGHGAPAGQGTALGWGRHTYDTAQVHEGAAAGAAAGAVAPSGEYLPGNLQKLEVDIIPCPDMSRNLICVQSSWSNGGICTGDLGGPLVINETVFGVASYIDHRDKSLEAEDHCAHQYAWAVYTPVTSHRLWIKKHTGV